MLGSLGPCLCIFRFFLGAAFAPFSKVSTIKSKSALHTGWSLQCTMTKGLRRGLFLASPNIEFPQLEMDAMTRRTFGKWYHGFGHWDHIVFRAGLQIEVPQQDMDLLPHGSSQLRLCKCCVTSMFWDTTFAVPTLVEVNKHHSLSLRAEPWMVGEYFLPRNQPFENLPRNVLQKTLSSVLTIEGLQKKKGCLSFWTLLGFLVASLAPHRVSAALGPAGVCFWASGAVKDTVDNLLMPTSKPMEGTNEFEENDLTHLAWRSILD